VSQPKPTWAGFKKALGISAGTAVGAAVVAMYINTFSNTTCIVAGDCSQISDIMKGAQLPNTMSQLHSIVGLSHAV
jgi:hypothetical protein